MELVVFGILASVCAGPSELENDVEVELTFVKADGSVALALSDLVGLETLAHYQQNLGKAFRVAVTATPV